MPDPFSIKKRRSQHAALETDYAFTQNLKAFECLG